MGVCDFTKPIYPQKLGGLNLAQSTGDGYSIQLRWDKAFVSVQNYRISYNIYYSTIRDDVFTEGVKFVSIGDDGYTEACIQEFTPGDQYFFAVKATQYDPSWMNHDLLQDGQPNFSNRPALKVYPETMLLIDITDSDLTIPILDIEDFPSYGVILIGTELISYTSKDIPNNTLIVGERGFLGSNVRFHQTDGYDGVEIQDPIIKFWTGFEDDNERIQLETPDFFHPQYAYTTTDGYAIKNDIVTKTTNLNISDTNTENFPNYDYVGYHRTDPRRLLRGECIGTYIGGEQWCADGYLGVGRQTRGVPINEQVARREEVLLETFGESVVLVRRLWEGIRCSCILQTTEHPEHRCPRCFGTGLVTGYKQFFNSRRSDGRIMVRFGPTQEDIKFDTAGLENVYIPDCWTMVYPSIKDRDFIIRFDENGNEECRYEILNVTRNVLTEGQLGAQKFSAQRIRKTDPIYMWKAIANTATMPSKITTSIGMLAGPGGIAIPHTHTVTINEGIISLSQIDQTTSVDQGHNHVVVNGEVQETLGHTHIIVI